MLGEVRQAWGTQGWGGWRKAVRAGARITHPSHETETRWMGHPAANPGEPTLIRRRPLDVVDDDYAYRPLLRNQFEPGLFQ